LIDGDNRTPLQRLDADQHDTARIVELDKAHFLHPWQGFDTFREAGALPIAAGEGVRLYDTDGRSYLDAVGGLWCTNIGLGRDEMAEAIAAQARRMAYASPFVDMTNVPATELAATLARLAPGDLDHVIYAGGGSTAIDSAYSLIQFYQNARGLRDKKHVIARHGSYHGSTFLARSIGRREGDVIPELDYLRDGIHHVSCPYPYRRPEGMSEAEFCDHLVAELEAKILEIGTERVAAFFAEPVLGAGGVIVPPKGYHRRTWEVCRRHDVLYVSDEVVTAFGRLGHWFASKDVFEIEPDIITTAKGLTSGYLPLGAAIFSDRIWQVISEAGRGRYYAQGYTYAGHPVSCAAALKNIEILEREQLLPRALHVGGYFGARLKELQSLPLVGETRGMGLMRAVEFVADRGTKALLPVELDIGKRIANAADARGLIVRPIVHLNVMSPALTITEAEIDFVVDTLHEAIRETADALVRDGVRLG
jgi:adenosylmethionine-8-amino-7-oxononanoate aminotransferase